MKTISPVLKTATVDADPLGVGPTSKSFCWQAKNSLGATKPLPNYLPCQGATKHGVWMAVIFFLRLHEPVIALP